jgi:acetyltransferase-like isoleucine patch superfamily enzyme
MTHRLGRTRYIWQAFRAQLQQLDERRALEQRFPSARLDPTVRVVNPQLLELGSDVLVQRGTLLHCGGFDWSFGDGAIRIGNGSTIADSCILLGAGTITLGEDVSIAQGCLILSSQDRFESGPDGRHVAHDFAPVKIEDGARVFSASIVTPGVTIGRGAVVGANSLVLEDVPAMELWAGTPARKLREIAAERWLPPRRQGGRPGSR